MQDISANDEFDNELLSAYVDGELTSEEQSLVEQRLRADPQARKLVEEMRLMSSALQALPRQTLGRDLRDDVLADTERATIAGRVTPATDPRINRWTGVRRGLVWSAITIAAVLLLMVTQPEEPQDADLADARRKNSAGEDRRTALAEETPRAVRGLDDVPKMSAAEKPSDSSDFLAEAASSPLSRGAAAEPADSEAVDKLRTFADPESELTFRSTAEVAEIEAAPAHEAPAEPAATGAMRGGEDASSPGAGSRQLASDSAMRNTSKAASVPLAATEALADAAEAAPPAPGSANLERYRETLAVDGDAPSEEINAGVKTQVVELATLTPEASSRFEELLSKNGIEFGDPALAAWSAPKDETAAVLRESDDSAAGEQVLVEASPEQIADLLVDCQADAETFAAVAPAEGDDDQAIAAGLGQAEKKGKEERAARYFGFGGLGGGVGGGLPPVRADEESPSDLPPQTAEKPAAQGNSQARMLGRAWRLPTPSPGATSLEKKDRSADGTVTMRRSVEAAVVQRAADVGAAGAAAPAVPGREPESSGRGKAATDAKQLAQVQVLFILRPAPAADAPPAKK